MKIAFLGSRGIPARYSGFETFYEQISTRLAKRGHDVTLYNRSHLFPQKIKEYNGVKIVTLPSLRSKHLETITHTALSTIHLMARKCDIAYYCIVGNAPLVWIPKLKGIPVLLNVDGADWAREKWGPFARWYQKSCERIAPFTANWLIADSLAIKERYANIYGSESIFVPYGANIKKAKTTAAIDKFGLRPYKYFFYVGRLVPENCVHILIEAYKTIETDVRLVIAGDSSYSDSYKRNLYKMADQRVVFTGFAFETDYDELSSHAYAVVQPSVIEGTRPAILDQLGFGNCVIARESKANAEVIGNAGIICKKEPAVESLRDALKYALENPEIVEEMKKKATNRINNFYNWEWITDFYEDLFLRIRSRMPIIDYDKYLSSRK